MRMFSGTWRWLTDCMGRSHKPQGFWPRQACSARQLILLRHARHRFCDHGSIVLGGVNADVFVNRSEVDTAAATKVSLPRSVSSTSVPRRSRLHGERSTRPRATRRRPGGSLRSSTRVGDQQGLSCDFSRCRTATGSGGFVPRKRELGFSTQFGIQPLGIPGLRPQECGPGHCR